MRFFDSCFRRVTLAEVSDDIARDIAFNNFLKQKHEAREREKAEALKKTTNKENTTHDKKTGNC